MADSIVVKISIPSQKLQKAVRINLSDQVWALKLQMANKISDVKETLNYGFLIRDGEKLKNGRFLMDEQKCLNECNLTPNSIIDFCMKSRVGAENSAKNQKKIIEDLQKGHIDKLEEKTTKLTEFNFWIDAAGTGTYILIKTDTPLTLAIGSGDLHLMKFMLQNGAFLDFRIGDQWKTPLHVAAERNKPSALKVILKLI
jgi:hypothetical protein